MRINGCKTARSCVLYTALLDKFNVVQLVASVVGHRGGSVKTEEHKEPLTFFGRDPVAFLSFGGLGAEVDVNASIAVLLERRQFLAPPAPAAASITCSRLKVAGFMRGGNSRKLSNHFAM